MTTTSERGIPAGRCFWGMQYLLRRFPGVISTRVGPTGGDVSNAIYRNHEIHAETVESPFDPRRLTGSLEFFFQIHDQTTPDRHGNNVRPNDCPDIFYASDEQRRTTERTILDVNSSGFWPNKVVTEVRRAGPFWEAEPEHQDYLERQPNGYNRHFIRPDWRLPNRAVTGRAG